MPRFAIETRVGRRGWRLYGGRLYARVPAILTVTSTSDDVEPLDHAVRIEIDVVDGRLACTEVRVARADGTGPAVTSDDLRRIPVASWVARAAEELGAVQAIVRVGNDEEQLRDFSWPPGDFADGGPTAEALESAAQIYSFCMATGQKVTAVMSERYGLPKQTASRWIAMAKRRGILVEKHRQGGFADDGG